MIGWLFRAVPICLYGSSSVLYVPSSIGHVLLGFGIPFLAFTPSTIAENWFAESQRFVAITIVSIGNLIGLMITYLFGEKLAEIGFTIGMQVDKKT